MANKIIISKEDLLEKKLSGMDKIANIVKRTLGPGGLPIIIEREGNAPDGSPLGPKITKDGVSVAEECSSEDPVEDVIIQAIKAICKKTNRDVGDGPQPLYSKIATPTGFKYMEHVKPGDVICGTNGTLQTVLGVFPKGQKEVYEVELEDGRIVECCSEHLWNTTTAWGTSETITTQEMKDNLLIPQKNEQQKKYRYYIPNTFVEMESQSDKMPLDPYLVGLLVGDGSLSGTGAIELSLGENKEHILSKIKLPKGMDFRVSYVDHKNYFRVKFIGKDGNGLTIEDHLSEIGLLGSLSATKHLPNSYLNSAKRDRESLLQGLLDTDGYINNRNMFEYSTVSSQLCLDFLQLTRSMGLCVKMNIHTRENDVDSYSNTPIFRIGQRKGYKHGLKVVDVEATGVRTEMQCIKVSNPNHLYLTDGFVTTHNTTTAIVLGQAILRAAQNALDEDPNLNPQLLKESIEESSKSVLEKLNDIATPITKGKIKQVATISANGDVEIGNIISEAFDHVGAEGVVTVDEGSTNGVTLEKVDGYQFGRGAEARDTFFNTKERTKFEADDVSVVLYDGKLQTMSQILRVLAVLCAADEQGRPTKEFNPTIFIANEFTPEVLQFLLIQNTERGTQFIAVQGPHMTSVRTQYYEDLASYTGGVRLGMGTKTIENITEKHVGKVDRAVITKYSTTLYGGNGFEEDILARVEQLKSQKDHAESAYDGGVISDRIAALVNGVAKIGVGGHTELEIKEKYDRIEDALNAARAAIEEGIIPGGGITLYKVAQDLKDSSIGTKVLKSALAAPFLQIMDNLGRNPEDIAASLTEIFKSKGMTYDARNLKVVNAMKAGIIDPVKVTKSALENAVSIASLLATAGGVIIFAKKKQ